MNHEVVETLEGCLSILRILYPHADLKAQVRWTGQGDENWLDLILVRHWSEIRYERARIIVTMGRRYWVLMIPPADQRDKIASEQLIKFCADMQADRARLAILGEL